MTLRRIGLIAAVCILLAQGGSPDAAPPEVSRRPLSPQEQLSEACQMCHSLELVRQQRIPRETWLAELKKMRGWGALVPAKDVDQLAEFLSTHYGPSAAPYQPARISAAAAQADGRIDFNAPPARGDAANGEKVYERACAHCHGIDARGVVGPNLAQRPILYEPHQWNEIVLKGLRRMPPFRSALSKSDSEDILVWLRRLSVR